MLQYLYLYHLTPNAPLAWLCCNEVRKSSVPLHISLVYKRYERGTIGGSTPLLYLLYPNIVPCTSHTSCVGYRGTRDTRGRKGVHLEFYNLVVPLVPIFITQGVQSWTCTCTPGPCVP